MSIDAERRAANEGMPTLSSRPLDLPDGRERVLALIAAGAPPDEVRVALDGLVAAQAAEQRRVEAQLREREGQYRAIFESTLDGLIINDLETGAVVEANSAAHRMHGYTYEAFLKLHPTE